MAAKSSLHVENHWFHFPLGRLENKEKKINREAYLYLSWVPNMF